MQDVANIQRDASRRPRLLLIDMTRIGDGTATGEVKSNLFADWPPDALMQIHAADGGGLGVYWRAGNRAIAIDNKDATSKVEKLAREFSPDLIVYRPTPRTPRLHRLAMMLISRLNKPFAVWIMDDWPTAYASENPHEAALLESDWRILLRHAAVRLSISDAMSEAFQQRYGLDFIAVANGVDEIEWTAPQTDKDGTIKVRYAGSLAENMTLASIVKVARAVERLADGGVNVHFEIKTRDLWRRLAEPHLHGLRHTQMIVADFEPAAYRGWLCEADISVIAYNFDEASQAYVKYSLANKLPECLASGAPLVAVGPPESATIKVLEKHDIGVRVTDNAVDAIVPALERLATSPALRRDIGSRGRKTAFSHFGLSAAQEKLAQTFFAASTERPQPIAALPEEPRSVGAQVDETAVVAQLMARRRGPDHVMIDVGAHHGTSAAYFLKLGWTIHCFEPDAANRKKLQDRFNGADTVSIDPRAVSDKSSSAAAFYTSQESTGISGLSAFRETHKETDRVDVTTVHEIVRDRKISAIDFLKIDVEGFDFSVLQGVPWEQHRPDVIECEFEDAKTKALGHTWRDIARYLAAKGYTVYISEWHPIVRYGIPHDWRRLRIFTEQTIIPADAWGNLLAFRDDPGVAKVEEAFAMLTKRRNAPNGGATTYGKAGSDINEHGRALGDAARPFYAEFAERLQKMSPRAFALARTVRRLFAALWRRKFTIAPAGIVIALVFLAGLSQGEGERRILVSGGAVLFGVFLVVLYLGWWTYHRVVALNAEITGLRVALLNKAETDRLREIDSAVHRQSRRLAGACAENETRMYDVEQRLGRLTKAVASISGGVTENPSTMSEYRELIAEIDEALNSLELDLQAIKGGEADIFAQIEKLQHRVDELDGAVRSVVDARVSLRQ